MNVFSEGRERPSPLTAIYFQIDWIDKRKLFGLSGEGFIFPLMMKLKLENINEDFGVTSLVSRVYDEKEYILLGKHGEIMDISKRFYKRVFKKFLTVSKRYFTII